MSRFASAGEDDALAALGVERLRAENPGLLTLSGSNTWIVGDEPAWVVDPGPPIEAHLDRLSEILGERGGLGGIAITHDHPDHAGAVAQLRTRLPAPLAAGRGEADVRLADGVRFGPFTALAAPGHAPDHFALIAGTVCFTGDAVLGEGSVFIAPDPGALSGYLDALGRLIELRLDVLCPGHGPAIFDPRRKLREYVEHRLDRERRLLDALDRGLRTTQELLDDAWSDVPEGKRPFAAVTLAAHLDKLADEGRLPDGVERPSWGRGP